MELLALEEVPIITVHIEGWLLNKPQWRVALEEGEDFLRVAVYGDDGELKKATCFPFTGMDAGAAQSWCAAGEQFLELVEKGWEPGGEGGPVIGWAEGMLAEQ